MAIATRSSQAVQARGLTEVVKKTNNGLATAVSTTKKSVKMAVRKALPKTAGAGMLPILSVALTRTARGVTKKAEHVTKASKKVKKVGKKVAPKKSKAMKKVVKAETTTTHRD
eukprot:GHVS01104650.1.p1 GENE.GHVS01104650.1~~GHVS01104650.1.p1  ORF type:complete len:113 (+),score=19.38 GHVS01104650.1:254-592(+)